jgi:hypothetical protein
MFANFISYLYLYSTVDGKLLYQYYLALSLFSQSGDHAELENFGAAGRWVVGHQQTANPSNLTRRLSGYG